MTESPLVELTCGGVAWRVDAEDAEVLRPEVLERVQDLDRAAPAEQIKDKRRRRVYRVDLSTGRQVVVKVFLVRTWRDRLKERVLGSKAAAEWAISRRLRGLGLPASRAIAVGCPQQPQGAVRGYLVIDAPRHAIGANHYLKRLGPPAEPSALEAMVDFTRRLARFVRRLHDAGVRHHDLHAGNILVREDAAPDEEPFLLIDVQDVRLGGPPSVRHRARAIAQLWNTFGRGKAVQGRLRRAFLEAYRAAGEALPGRLHEEAIRRCAARQRARRVASRARRCVKDSTRFAVVTARGRRIFHRRDYSVPEVDDLLARHRAAVDAPAEGRGAPLVSRHPGRGDAELEVWEFPPPRGLRRLLGYVRGTPGRRAYARAHRQWVGERTGPRALAAVECRRGGERGRSFAILERGPRERGEA